MAKKLQQDKQDNQEQEKAPEVKELLSLIQQLQESNKDLSKRLNERDDAERKRKEEKEKRELESAMDLEKLLSGELDSRTSGDDDDEDEDRDVKKKKRSSGGDIEDLSNKELLELVASSVDKFVGAHLTKASQRQKEDQDGFLKKLTGIETVLGSMVAQTGIESLRAKHSDFDEYRKDIADLLKETPGLSLERAYKLAKAEKLSREPASDLTDTERPDIPAGPAGMRLVPRTGRDTEVAPDSATRQTNVSGLPAFRSFLDEGLNRVLSRRRQ